MVTCKAALQQSAGVLIDSAITDSRRSPKPSLCRSSLGLTCHVPTMQGLGRQLRLKLHSDQHAGAVRSPVTSSGSKVMALAGNRPPSFTQPGVSMSQPAPGQELYLPFRPPVQDETDYTLTYEEQLEILRDRRGLWHEYAPHVSSLQGGGYGPSVIDQLTGMTGVEQNTVVVAAQVYNSLKTSGLSEESLSYFDVGGAEVLYELRILSIQQRLEAAEYVIQERMDAEGACQVARAIKDHERRKVDEGRETFSKTPADCLAFSYYRQSKESRSAKDKENWLLKASAVATSESARKRINQALGLVDPTDPANDKPAIVARIEAIRLFEKEAVVRPVPVVGDLESLTVASLFRVSSDSPVDGPFGIFKPAAGSQWVALPGWSPLLRAKRPAVITIADTKQLPTFGSKVSSEALLLIDRGNDDADIKPGSFYVIADLESGKGLTFATGAELVDKKLNSLAKVLMLLLPPKPHEEDEMVDWE